MSSCSSHPQSQGLPLAWQLVAQLSQFLWWAFLFVTATGLLVEVAARLLRQKPQMIVETLSATVPDPYAGWQLRPSVQTGPEWIITNSRGLHDLREIPLKPDGKHLRVAVQGSSVVYGPGTNLKDTLSVQLERALTERGMSAEVLNFGVHGYNLLNVLGQAAAYTVQYEPRAVVLMLDLQVSYPAEPSPAPAMTLENSTVKQLSTLEGWLKRGSQHSVVLTWVDSPSKLRQALAVSPLPLKSSGERVSGARDLATPPTPHEAVRLRSSAARAPADVSPASPPGAVGRSRRLRSILAAIVTTYREAGIAVVLVPPFGPYYAETDSNLAGFSLAMIANHQQEYGSFRLALEGELARITSDIQEVGSRYDAVVLNLDDVNRRMTLATSDHISSDGIHPTPSGYQFLAGRIADSLGKQLGSAGRAVAETGRKSEL